MSDGTPSASPDAIPETTVSTDPDSPDFGEVMEVADRLFERHKLPVMAIMHALLHELHQNGPLHFKSVLSISDEYQHCAQELLPAAYYLRDRGLIKVDRDPGNCDCASCIARRTTVCLAYNFTADGQLIVEERRREAERAQRAAQNVVNMHRKYEGFVYLIKCGERYKIGITNDMSRRMDQLRGQSPYPLELVHHAKGYNNAGKESTLHKRYAEQRVHGEWFELSPDHVAEIIEHLNEWARDGSDV